MLWLVAEKEIAIITSLLQSMTSKCYSKNHPKINISLFEFPQKGFTCLLEVHLSFAIQP